MFGDQVHRNDERGTTYSACVHTDDTEIPTIIDPSATKKYSSTTGSIIVGISVNIMTCVVRMRTKMMSVGMMVEYVHVKVINIHMYVVTYTKTCHRYVCCYIHEGMSEHLHRLDV